MSKTLCRILCGGLTLLLFGAFAAADDPDKEVTHRFKIGLAGKLELEIKDKTKKQVNDTELVYVWQRKGSERILSFESMQDKTTVNGKEVRNGSMSRTKVVAIEDGKADELLIEDAPPDIKRLLTDSFGSPLCKLQVDETGKEIKRTIVAGPGAKPLIDAGTINTAVLFHPPFPADKDQWQVDFEWTAVEAGSAKGKLTYKKVPGGNGGQVVKVSGTLINDSFTPPGSPVTVKNIRYVASGEQTYDAAQKEWVSGKLSFDVSSQAFVNEKSVGASKGAVVITFEKLPAKK